MSEICFIRFMFYTFYPFLLQNMEQQIETSGKRKRKNPAPNRFSPADENVAVDLTEKLLNKVDDTTDENDNEATENQERFAEDQGSEEDDNDSGMVRWNITLFFFFLSPFSSFGLSTREP